MKKMILISSLLIASFFCVQAQFQTIGLRMGFGGELSAQFDGGAGRIEFDLGIYRNYSSAALAYQLVNPLEGDFTWYYGAGGIVGFENNNGVSAGPIGVLGIEYNFGIPLQLSFDYRPEFYILRNGAIDFHANLTGVGFSARYRF